MGLSEDAKGLLEQLNALGEPARSEAEEGVRKARAVVEGVWPSLEAHFKQRKTELEAALAEAKSGFAVLARRKPGTVAPPWSEIEAKVAAYRVSLEGMTSAREAYVTAANAKSPEAVRVVTDGLKTRRDAARDALRALLPAPVGARPATKAAKCARPGGTFDCTVPNGPPSDDEWRSANDAGRRALSDRAKIADSAYAEFVQRANTDAQALQAKLTNLMNALGSASRAVHETTLTILRNMS